MSVLDVTTNGTRPSRAALPEYPDTIGPRLPVLLGRLKDLQADLASLLWDAHDLADAIEQTSNVLDDVSAFVSTRVQINRARESRRVRHYNDSEEV